MLKCSSVALFLFALLVSGGGAWAQDADPAPSQSGETAARGTVVVDVSNILGRSLPARIEVRRRGDTALVMRVEAPRGKVEFELPVGEYDLYVHVYEHGVPLLVEIKAATIRAGQQAYVLVSLLEGASGNTPLRSFDRDFDLALDRVELEAGTDPNDAASIPGERTYPVSTTVLKGEAGWYVGDLHAFSSYSIGKESVGELVRRAEQAGLDFLAITDVNTLAHTLDPAFTSEKVVMVPAMKWGVDGLGYALLYAPRTFPRLTRYPAEAQAQMVRVQMQGGAFAIAHPCFPTSPWQWPVLFPNAVEVWRREWRTVPPLGVEALRPELRERDNGGGYAHPLARAAASAGHSANGQALLYMSSLLRGGMRACVIGGSHSASPAVPLGRPLTYVYAREKSVAGIVEGIRYGRTYVTAGPEAPRLHFSADVGVNRTIDAAIGDTVPLGVPVRFIVNLWEAKGKRLEVLRDGHTIRSTLVEDNSFVLAFDETHDVPCFYQVRVTQPGRGEGFGYIDMLALSSPIYVNRTPVSTLVNPEDAWISIQSAEPEKDEPWRLPEGAQVIEVQPEILY